MSLADWTGDGSLWSLLAANLLTLVMALVYEWDVSAILLVYWGQSVIIGIANAVRMISLRDFSTEGFKVNGERPEEIPQTKWSTAVFFLLHYGFFHVVYLMFLITDARDRGTGSSVGVAFGLVMVAFAVNHFYSLRYNMEVDRRGKL